MVLIGGPREDARETATGEVNGDLRFNIAGPADRCQERARGRKLRLELSGIPAVIGNAGIADSTVAGRKQDGDATAA